MASIPTTTMRIDPQLKEESSRVLEDLGLTLSGAVTIFLKAVVREQGLPFEVKRKRRMADKVIRIKDLRPQDVRGFRGDTVSADGLVDWYAPHVAQ